MIMKTEMLNQINGTPSDFFEFLCSMRAISAINGKLCPVINRLHDNCFSADAQKTLYIILSLMDDGNACLSLNPPKLLDKWEVKWNGIVQQAIETSEEQSSEDDFPLKDNFKKTIDNGCVELAQNAKPPIIVTQQDGEPVLFFQKYYEAKGIIESCFKVDSNNIFVDGKEISKDDKDHLKKEMEDMLKPNGNIKELKEAQVDAIAYGQQQNLIITGGPGTGKTTVIFFLLWNLMKKDKEKEEKGESKGIIDWNIYFAAPSGKAAYRLRESLVECFEDIKATKEGTIDDTVARKLKKDGQTSYTIHRLLKFNAAKNEFFYNEKNRLPEKSIFVIDEASMIDLTMFAAFMRALPQKDFMLYILGDKDQLPSVEAGAVLGEMLDVDRKCIVRLTESNRFNQDSKIGRLARFIQTQDDSEIKEHNEKIEFTKWDTSDTVIGKEEDEVRYIKLLDENAPQKQKEEETIERILEIWKNNFYQNLVEMATAIRPDLTETNNPEEWPEELNRRKTLWKSVEQARILSAERRGPHGVESLNRIMMDKLGKRNSIYFDGCLVMLNKNQNFFGLFNGDSGIVVNSSTHPMLMLLRGNDFVFYPLSYFPEECLEPAFAITIHKSQGSGYPNIMMFLPSHKGHPLVNRQILYTGVTRTKKRSIAIIASPETFKAACGRPIDRSTGIEL
jgi:exodeoxyribonuclease V alpha subunit